ncbi:MAG: LptF/LptG family permease [Candidatus Delongbacteria bacterium]|nr:LptF/LptG family permease [Candidatus Delongbacteria bacterium]
MKILYRYIFFQLLPPYFFAVFVITGIMLANEVIYITDLILKRGVPFGIIGEVTLLSLSHIAALSVPMAILLSSIMTYGKLTEDNEMMAMKASGINLYHLIKPALVFGVLNLCLMFWFHNTVLPNSNYRLKNIMYQIRNFRPTMALEEGIFNRIGDDISIYINQLDHQQNMMYDLMIYDYQKSRIPTIIQAKSGRLSLTSDNKQLILDLNDGEIHRVESNNESQYTKINFEHFQFRYGLANTGLDSIDLGRGQREMDVTMMRHYIDTLELRIDQARQRIRNHVLKDCNRLIDGQLPSSFQTLQYLKNEENVINSLKIEINQYWVEIYKKFAIPFACLVFIIIGVPMGVRSRRGGVGPAITISLIFFVFYYGCLTIGEELGDDGTIPAWLAMWFANILLLGYGCITVYRTVQEVEFFQWDRIMIWKRWKLFQTPSAKG